METLVYNIIDVQFVKNLKALKNCMMKAKAHAEANKFEANKFLDMKLAPDMFNFMKQVQIATDNAKGAVARLTGTNNPVFTDNETTFEELLQRVDKTIDFMTKFKAQDFANYANQKASFPWYPGMHLEAMEYLTAFAIPNFYFHLTTAYNLLRHSGVQIGKTDYLGEIAWKKD